MLFQYFSILALTSATVLHHPGSEAPRVTIKNGTLVGRHSNTYNEDFFLGIPYAQPPVEQLRFRNPTSLNKTFGTRQATEYSPLCYGYGSDQFAYNVSEDCLTLNVVRPSGSYGKLPVAVWIHGGGFFQGGSGDHRYNLSFIVQNSVKMGKPIIGVSLNYRLAGWGFLGGDTVVKAGVANLGLKDQRLALHWIQENIGAFGGDPTKVTIWGESAGASSVNLQLLAYGGRDDKLFRGVIAESLWLGYSEGNKTAQNRAYQNLTELVGCSTASDTLNCLRAVPLGKLNQIINSTTFNRSPRTYTPVIDGDFIHDLDTNLLNAGKFVKVPFLIGSNTDEGTSFSPGGINTTQQFVSQIKTTGIDRNTSTIIEQLYPDIPAIGIPQTYKGRPPPALGLQWKRSCAFWGDLFIHAIRRQRNIAWSKSGTASYSYRFNALNTGVSLTTGSTHFQEVAYVFDNTKGEGYTPPISVNPFGGKPQNYDNLAELMSRMWVSFVHDLDPNNHGVKNTAHWPAYNATDGYGENFVFDTNTTSHAELDTWRAEGIAFINAVSAVQFGK